MENITAQNNENKYQTLLEDNECKKKSALRYEEFLEENEDNICIENTLDVEMVDYNMTGINAKNKENECRIILEDNECQEESALR